MSSQLPALKGPRAEIRRGDALYPPQLEATCDPPQILHVTGEPAALVTGLAIVGARKATPYGLKCARLFANIAASSGVTVVSGGAIGCDQAAHASALGCGGRCIAVLGCGADVCYPKTGAALLQRIVDSGGAVVSEAPWGSQPNRWAFVRRNRIIAGLSGATLIVEAGLPSGTFSTADATLEAGREVLVVPGSIFSPESQGSNRLISQGATPVVDEETFRLAMLGALGLLAPVFQDDVEPAAENAPRNTGRCPDEQRAMRYIKASPMRPDELAISLGIGIPETMHLLTSLEASGVAERYRDGRYGPSSAALRLQGKGLGG